MDDLDAAMADLSTDAGDSYPYRKTLARCVVDTVLLNFQGRRFNELSVLELGAGAGFFAAAFAEVYPNEMLPNLVQTDANPREGDVVACPVSALAEKLSGRTFDVVLSLDFLSSLAFGAGLDPEDDADVDTLGHLSDLLPRVLRPGGFYYDFTTWGCNSQFVMRFVPDYCSRRPGRFVCVLDPDQTVGRSDGATQDEDAPLLFVTFGVAGLLAHEQEADAAEGAPPLLRVAGFDTPFSYDALREQLGLPSEPPRARAFALKVHRTTSLAILVLSRAATSAAWPSHEQIAGSPPTRPCAQHGRMLDLPCLR